MKILWYFIALQLSVGLLQAQDIKTIQLQTTDASLTLTSYHVVGVKDDRADTSQVGKVRAGFFSKKEVALQLQNGAARQFQAFANSQVKQSAGNTPVELHVISIQIQQTAAGLKGRMEVSLTLGYYSQNEKITEFAGTGYAEGPVDHFRTAELLIRKALESSLQQFDKWWAANKAQYMAVKGKPASVTVNSIIKNTPSQKNYIVYAPDRPLRLTDFVGQPDTLSADVANTYSGIEVNCDIETKDGHVNVLVHITPYVDIHKSWCRVAARNDYTLLHEQKHFDITALKACALLDTIQRYHFTADYINEIKRLYAQIQGEVDQLQNGYDAKTKNGLLRDVQQQWNIKIAEELKKRNCYSQ
jgi:hypothetical protein